MCMSNEVVCGCGKEKVSFHYGDSILPEEIIMAVYCPECSGVDFNPLTMIKDNDWVIEYDLDVARMFTNQLKVKKEDITPDFIFDSGFATWNGYTPNDLKAAAKEKTVLLELAKLDMRKYLSEIKNWTESRLKRLSEEGWRKAKNVLAAA